MLAYKTVNVKICFYIVELYFTVHSKYLRWEILKKWDFLDLEVFLVKT